MHILRKLPIFDSDPDLLREIASEYAEMADFCRNEGRVAAAEMLEMLASIYDPTADLVERYGLVKSLGEGLVEQARAAIAQSRLILDGVIAITRH